MGRIIRRTVTITVTGSWTITWTEDAQADDEPQPHVTTSVKELIIRWKAASGIRRSTLWAARKKFLPVWDKARVLDLIDHFSTAFLLDTLKGDKAAHAVLLPDAATFPGIEYMTTMK